MEGDALMSDRMAILVQYAMTALLLIEISPIMSHLQLQSAALPQTHHLQRTQDYQTRLGSQVPSTKVKGVDNCEVWSVHEPSSSLFNARPLKAPSALSEVLRRLYMVKTYQLLQTVFRSVLGSVPKALAT